MDGDKTTTDVEETTQPVEPKGEEASVSKAEAQEVPKAKTITIPETELEKRISDAVGGHKGTIKKLQDDLKKAQEEIHKSQAASEELGYAKFLSEVEAKGGDLDAAHLIVEGRRNNANKMRELSQIEERINAGLADIDKAARVKKATDLINELKLDSSVQKDLLESPDPAQMELKALRLALTKKESSATPSRKTDSGSTSTKGGRDMSKLSDSEKMGYAIEHIENT